MDEKQKERIKKLYGSNHDVMPFILYPGTKIGNTTKSRLRQGSVKCLED